MVFRPRLYALLLLLALPCLPTVHAQGRESSLSDKEVEELREYAYDAPQRLGSFIKFLDDRTRAIDKVNAGKRHAGREEDTHDLLEQFVSISEDLDDNMDDWSKRHQDVRKVLPRLLAATERWQTAIKSPPDNEAYNVSRKLALDAVTDLRDTATRLLEEQKAYFLAHPANASPKAEGGKAKPE